VLLYLRFTGDVDIGPDYFRDSRRLQERLQDRQCLGRLGLSSEPPVADSAGRAPDTYRQNRQNLDGSLSERRPED
jgi:hypothetical protein